MFTCRSERDSLEAASTGLMGGEASVRSRLDTVTKTDDLLNKTLLRPTKERKVEQKRQCQRSKTDPAKKCRFLSLE